MEINQIPDVSVSADIDLGGRLTELYLVAVPPKIECFETLDALGK